MLRWFVSRQNESCLHAYQLLRNADCKSLTYNAVASTCAAVGVQENAGVSGNLTAIRPLSTICTASASTSKANESQFTFVRNIFGAAKAHSNLQIHKHEKYKHDHPQPSYDWMVGRFVMDRNGVVWHKQSNQNSKRHKKSSNQLSRLGRWKALQPTIAAKFRKLPGVKERLRYWAPPEPTSVPGFDHYKPHVSAERKRMKVNKIPVVGDPALIPH